MRGKILDEAKVLINGERQDQYGAPEDSFATIAGLWSVYLEKTVTAKDVALLMTLLKIARERKQHKQDNIADGLGYLALADDISEAGTAAALALIKEHRKCSECVRVSNCFRPADVCGDVNGRPYWIAEKTPPALTPEEQEARAKWQA